MFILNGVYGGRVHLENTHECLAGIYVHKQNSISCMQCKNLAHSDTLLSYDLHDKHWNESTANMVCQLYSLAGCDADEAYCMLNARHSKGQRMVWGLDSYPEKRKQWKGKTQGALSSQWYISGAFFISFLSME